MSGLLANKAMWLDLPPAKRLVLVSLCHYADDRTGEAFPGLGSICAMTGLSDRTVKPYLRQLEDEGFIAAKKAPGYKNRRSTTRFLAVARIVTLGSEREEAHKAGRFTPAERRLWAGEETSPPPEEQLPLGEAAAAGGEDDVARGEVRVDGGEDISPPPGEAASPRSISDPSVAIRHYDPPLDPSITPPIAPPADAGALWALVLVGLRQRVTPLTDATWLRDTTGVEIAGRTLLVTAPNDAVAQWLSSRLKPVINQAAGAVLGPGWEVRFVPRAPP